MAQLVERSLSIFRYAKGPGFDSQLVHSFLFAALLKSLYTCEMSLFLAGVAAFNFQHGLAKCRLAEVPEIQETVENRVFLPGHPCSEVCAPVGIGSHRAAARQGCMRLDTPQTPPTLGAPSSTTLPRAQRKAPNLCPPFKPQNGAQKRCTMVRFSFDPFQSGSS